MHSSVPTNNGVDLRGTLHDVSNALTVLLHWLSEAQRAVSRGDNPSAALESAIRQARHGSEIARAALGGTSPDTTRPTNCNLFTKQLARDLAALQGSSQLTLRVTESTNQVALAHPSSARQVLTNLLLNALAATEPGGQVQWSAECFGERFARFVIEDDGPGFTDTQRNRIFASGLESANHSGEGHGLKQAKRLTHDAGGTLRLLQHRPHASFEILWPLMTNSFDEQRSPVSNSPQTHPAVVVVEDDPAILQLIRLRLGQQKIQLHAYGNWAEARSWLQSEGRADLLLTDLSPLGNNPWAELSSVRSDLSVPIVLMTGQVDMPRDVSEKLIAHVIRKPFEIDDVVEQVLQMLRNSTRPQTRSVQT